MSNRIRTIAVAAASMVALAATSLIVAASANAAAPAAVWVGVAHAGAPANSCTHPGYNSIQPALNAVANGGTVHVCGGRYVEQLQITRPVTITGQNSPVVVLPSNPVDSTTACETAIPSSYQPNQDGIAICTSGTVRISNLAVDAAWPAGTCYDSLYGIFAAGGGSFLFNFVNVVAAGAVPLNGCQGGVGIQVGTARTSPNETGKLTMTNSSVSGYQKNGIDIAGAGTTGKISTTSVAGAGATDQIAQNGIEIADGALGTISGTTVSDNECDVSVCGPNPLTDTQSTGMLIYGASPKTTVASSTFVGNDIGVYYAADPSSAAPKIATVIKGNKLTDNRYEGISLDQGYATVNGNTYSGGNIGLSVIQYDGQTFGGAYAVSNENISGQSQAAIEIDSDNAADDQPGKATLSNVAVHGGVVINQSTNFVIVAHNLH